jgi:hypothetical protein
MEKSRWRHRAISGASLVAVFGIALAGHSLAAPQAAGGSGYHLVKKVVLGGEGDWDYLEVDPATHHLLIPRGEYVMVVDPDQGKVIGNIPKTPFVHGIAVAPDFSRGYTTNGNVAEVTIFDTNTLKTIGVTKTSKEPDAILYDPSSKRVFSMGRGGASTAIDAATGNAVGTVPLGSVPEFAVADGKGHVFVDLEEKNDLLEFNSHTLKVEHEWPLAPCTSPSGLAIDAEHERLVVGCHNKIMAFVDGTNGKVVGTVPIGAGVDANRFDPETGLAFASCGDGTLTVAHEDSPDKFTLVDTIKTQAGARTMALDYATHTVYLVTAEVGPAPPGSEGRGRRPGALPNTFTLLIFKR